MSRFHRLGIFENDSFVQGSKLEYNFFVIHHFHSPKTTRKEENIKMGDDNATANNIVAMEKKAEPLSYHLLCATIIPTA